MFIGWKVDLKIFLLFFHINKFLTKKIFETLSEGLVKNAKNTVLEIYIYVIFIHRFHPILKILGVYSNKLSTYIRKTTISQQTRNVMIWCMVEHNNKYYTWMSSVTITMEWLTSTSCVLISTDTYTRTNSVGAFFYKLL